jgi:hypothetical protein
VPGQSVGFNFQLNFTQKHQAANSVRCVVQASFIVTHNVLLQRIDVALRCGNVASAVSTRATSSSISGGIRSIIGL